MINLNNAKKEVLSLKLKIDESLANSIRRSVFEIPTLAVEELEISKNESPLYNEVIAHRVGLIPLKKDVIKDKKNLPTFKLDSKGPGFVYSRDLKGDVELLSGDMPITYLGEGQKLSFVAKTIFGTGLEHSKFLPGFIFYRKFFDVKIDKKCPKRILEFPGNFLEEEKGIIKIKEGLDESTLTNLVEFSKKFGRDLIKINPTESLFLSIESFGQIPPKKIFEESVKELKKNLKEFSKKL